MLYTFILKRIKYLGINLPKEAQSAYCWTEHVLWEGKNRECRTSLRLSSRPWIFPCLSIHSLIGVSLPTPDLLPAVPFHGTHSLSLSGPYPIPPQIASKAQRASIQQTRTSAQPDSWKRQRVLGFLTCPFTGMISNRNPWVLLLLHPDTALKNQAFRVASTCFVFWAFFKILIGG